MTAADKVLVIVGGGPSSVYVLERLAALSREELPVTLRIIVLERTGRFGDGAVHSSVQPEVSFLNRIAGQVSFAADETVQGAGRLLPPHERLNLAQWCQARFAATGDGRYDIAEADWPKRYMHGEALREHFGAYVRRLAAPEGVSVELLEDEVIDIETLPDSLSVHCASGRAIRDVDHVLLVTGHAWNDPRRTPQARARSEFAARNALTHLGCAYPLEDGLSEGNAAPGSVVACEGMGLTAIDVILYLTEGRGGRFREQNGRLVYEACGAEPARIIPFASSGLFTFARPSNHKQRDLARYEHRGIFFTEDAVDRLRSRRGVQASLAVQLDFQADLFPLMVAEMAWVYHATLLGGDFGRHLCVEVQEDVARFLGASRQDAEAAASAMLATLEATATTAKRLIDERLTGGSSLETCRARAQGWDFSLAAASFVQCVWGPLPVPIGTILSDERPLAHLHMDSPYGLPVRARDHVFDWQTSIRPIRPSDWSTPAEYRRALLAWIELDHQAAAQGNLANPAKAAADGVWRDLRHVIAHAIDRGGLTPESHRRFLGEFMRHHNRLANGAALEVMEKIRALVECELVDVGVGPGGRVELDNDGCFRVLGPFTGFVATADVLVDGTVHAFDPRRDRAPLYRALLARGIVRPWVNIGVDGTTFQPGGLDLSASFHPLRADGAEEERLTILGPPSEGVVFFQLGALRPDQDHHVMQDVLTWVNGLRAQGFLRSAAQAGAGG